MSHYSEIKISIYTQIYNTKPYLRQCLDSVLNQTHENFEYILIDRGSNDGSQDILQEYAKKDSRIQLIRFEDNATCPTWFEILKTIGNGKYIANVDSDDWLELDFLEQMLSFAEENKLDIASTGSRAFYEETKESSLFLPPFVPSWIIQKSEFGEMLSKYYGHFSVNWGKLMRMDIARSVFSSDFNDIPLIPGPRDTILSFRWLRFSSRIGIHDSILHHYRRHTRSLISTYDSRTFDLVVYLYNDMTLFLKSLGYEGQKGWEFLNDIFLASLIREFQLLKGTSLMEKEKEANCWRMFSHPITENVFCQGAANSNVVATANVIIINCLEEICSFSCSSTEKLVKIYHLLTYFSTKSLCNWKAESREKQEIISLILKTAVTPSDGVQQCIQILAPRCYAAITAQNAELFLQDRSFIRKILGDQRLEQFFIKHHRMFLLFFGPKSPFRFVPGNSIPLFQSLLQDDADNLLRRLKLLAHNKRIVKQYALLKSIRALCLKTEEEENG